MKSTLPMVAILSGLLVGSNTLFADILAGWDVDAVDVDAGTGIDDVAFPYTKSATALGGNVAAGELSLGFDGPSATANMYGFKFSASTHQTSLSGAIENSNYIQFTVVAGAGYRLDLSSIEMMGGSGTSGPDDIALMSDVDGFVAGSEIASLSGRQGAGPDGWDTDLDGWGAPIDLSGSQYKDLDAVTFRIYGWNSSGATSSGIRNLSGNDLVVNGTMKAIPEPAAIGFVFLAGIGILVARRFGK